MTTTNGDTSKRIGERELRETLRSQFTEAIAAGQPRKARRLLESFWLWDGFGGSELWDRFRPRGNIDDDVAGTWLPPSVPSDRRHGSDWPIFRTQPELDQYRQRGRILAATNAFAKGILRHLTNTVIGKGYNYKVQILDENGKPAADEQLTDEGKQYMRAVNEVVDRFLKINHWNCTIDPTDKTALGGTRERYIFRTIQVDGECFLRFHGRDDGTCLVRPIDASQIRDGGKYLPQDGWTYGIQHEMEPFEDVETPLTYAVFWPDSSAKGGEGGHANDYGTWEEIDAEEILHLKGPDTPANVKRGLSMFLFDIGEAIERASKLQRNASTGAAVRAGVAWTEQWSQATQAQLTSFQSAVATRQGTNSQGRTVFGERIPPGTIRRVPENYELADAATDNTQSYLTGKEGDLQEAAAGVGIAAFVLGGLESGNYSNFESASYPPVVNAQCEQEYYKLAFSRAIWKAITWAVKCGLLPVDVEEKVCLTVEAPAVMHRNELEKAQEDQIGVTNGWKDRQTCAAERGLDWHQIEANNEEYQQKQQEMMPQSQPGQPGAKPPGQNGQPPKPKMAEPHRPTRESFDESEPRDDSGKWTSGGGGGSKAEIGKRLDAILNKGGELDQAQERLQQVKQHLQWALHVHELNNGQFALFYNPGTGKSGPEHIVDKFKTEQEAEYAWHDHYDDKIAPHKARVRKLEKERDEKLKAYDLAENKSRTTHEGFDPSEKRDESGQWTSGEGGGRTHAQHIAHAYDNVSKLSQEEFDEAMKLVDAADESDLKAALKLMDFRPVGDPRKQVKDMISRRRDAVTRSRLLGDETTGKKIRQQRGTHESRETALLVARAAVRLLEGGVDAS